MAEIDWLQHEVTVCIADSRTDYLAIFCFNDSCNWPGEDEYRYTLSADEVLAARNNHDEYVRENG